MMNILLIYGEWILKIIEMNKIVLLCMKVTGQVIYYKVMMDIHRKMKNMIIIVSEVVKIGLSKQQQLSFMELIHKQILNNILSLEV